MKKVIYQLLPRLFGNSSGINKVNGSIEDNGCGKFNDINDKALVEIKKLGVTDIWLTGIVRHATTTNYSSYGIKCNNPLIVKGRAGSPYAVTDFYDVDPDLAVDVDSRMVEFEDLVKRIHQKGMKVIIDLVANHVSREYDATSLGGNLGANDNVNMFFHKDNAYYYMQGQTFGIPHRAYEKVTNFCNDVMPYDEYPARVTGDDAMVPNPSFYSWYDTVKLNYGIDISDGSRHFNPIPEMWYTMRDVMLFWLSKKIDGFRCDMAEMVPVEFWEWCINEVKSRYPNTFFIAEIYQPELYYDYIDIARFDYLYDKIDLYDTLRAIVKGHSRVEDITRCWQHTMMCNNRMLRFLENHDEERIASDNFAGDPLKAIPAFAVAAFMHQGPVMLYNGQELGEKSEDTEGFGSYNGKTSIFDYWCLDTQRRWINGGNFSDEHLTDKEKQLREKYREILNFAISNAEIANGDFYDLMWINTYLINLNCYAFLRNIGSRYIVFVMNFNPDPVSVNIVLSEHVRDFLGLKAEEDIIVHCDVDGYGWKACK